MKPAQTTIQSRVSSLAALTALLTLLWSHLGTTENAVGGSLRTYASEQKSPQPQEPSPERGVEPPRGASAAPPAVPGGPQELPALFHLAAPGSLDDLKAIEHHVKHIAPGLSTAVVAVQLGGANGSGVVISADGLVLTAAHVCEAPNRDVRFTFPDGTTARGKTLGTNHELDAGMMKITDRGPWPHVEIGDLAQSGLGDWVLTLGHPGGFDPQRPVVVRLGRIIRLSPEAVQTDCTVSAGDSGGALFDMRGRVIGIHSRISDSTAENFHVPITTYRETWDRLVNGENWGEQRPPPRAWIGARGVDDPDGCRLELVDENGPAARAGVKAGDIVRTVNKQPVKDYASFRRFVAAAKPGEELELELVRDRKEMLLTVKVETRPWRR